jgi:hypothetical protein
LSIGEDQDEGAPGSAATGDAAADDFDNHDLDDASEIPAAVKWGMAGLVVVYAGLGSYCVASVLGSMAGNAAGAHPEGVTRSVAAAMTNPVGSSQSSDSEAGAASSDTVAAAKVYAAKAARRAQAAGLGESADSQAPAPMPVEVLMAVGATAIGPDGAADGDHPQLAPYVIDPHSATAWITHWYASANFGNLKDGTGLLLDMGKPVTIKQVELALGGSPGFWGADLEIRIGDRPNLGGVAPVAMAMGVGGWLSADLRHPVTGRYIQIWFTKLPLDSWGTYQEHVYGVTVRGSQGTPPARSGAGSGPARVGRGSGHDGSGHDGGRGGHGGGRGGHGGDRGHGGDGYYGGHSRGGDGYYGGHSRGGDGSGGDGSGGHGGRGHDGGQWHR